MSTNIIHSTAVMLCMIAQIVLSAFAPWIRNPLIANAAKSAISNLFTILIFFAFTTYTSFFFYLLTYSSMLYGVYDVCNPHRRLSVRYQNDRLVML